MAKRRSNKGLLSSIFGPKVTYHSRIVRTSGREKGTPVSNYKGITIREDLESGGFRLSKIDRESIFDTVNDAKGFIDYQMKQRNPAPEGYNKTWYQKGYKAGSKNASNGDYVQAWKNATNKPGESSTDGRRITAQESFYLGYHNGQEIVFRQRNPRKPPLNKWIKVKKVKVTRTGIQIQT